jgi:hypothetical protein
MKARILAASAALAALAGCGSPTDNTTFAPPASFHSIASIGPFVQMWQSGSDQMLMLFAMPVKSDLHDAMSQANVKDIAEMNTETIKICDGKQQAIFVTGDTVGKTSSDGKTTKPQKLEMILTDISGKTYMAMYMRPMQTPADTAAEASIKNLCTK